MNSCRMTLRILITLLVMLAFVSSLATAAKIEPKPTSLKAIGAGNIPAGTLKAMRAGTAPDKNPIDPFDRASKIAPRIHHPGLPQNNGRSGFLTEGFEGTVPPSGWSSIVNNANTWEVDTYAPHSGLQNATVYYDFNQNEWMITPVLNFASATSNLNVSFWWNMSYYWGVSPYDNYNLELWISTDGGSTWPTKLWDESAQGVFTTWVWYQATVSLASYVGQANVKLGFRYVGNDGAQGSLDDIYVNDDAPPTGRCCYNAGADCKDNTAAECSAIGGTWDGALTCATPCPVPGVGDNCANPIIVNIDTQLPYADLSQYTCGRVSDYAGMTCLGSYDGGEDIIYRLDVATAINVNVTLDPKGTLWTGFAIGTSCPPAGTCVLVKTDYSGAAYGGVAALSPGTYYLIVSTWPTPDCITAFDLTIEKAVAVANDDCANAIDISDVTNLPFSTAAATFDGPGGFISGPNIWYRYKATCTGAATASLCGSSYDTKVRVFDGGTCPTDPTSLAENDDACGVQSSATFACVAGNDYMIEVGGYSSASGNGLLSVNCFLPPPNDNCASATPVPLVEGSPLTFTGNNSGATSDCSLLGDPEVWHAFTTTECMNVTVNYCGTTPSFGNIYVALAQGCPCGSYVLYSSYDWTTCGDGNITIRYDYLPAGTWYLPVLDDPANSASGPYTIHVSGIACPPAPPNDNCESVTPVLLASGVTTTFHGDNTGSTNDCASFPGGQTWEAFILPTCMDLTLTYCGTSPAFGNVWLNLSLGCPCTGFTAAGTWEASSCGDGNISITWLAMPAGTYYYPVLLDPANGSIGPYQINVKGVTCPVGYCAASSSVCDEFISKVQVGTINNPSGCSHYADYTGMSTDMTVGGSYPITITNGPPTYSSDQCGIWVDWNQNTDFSDPGEQITVVGTPGNGPYTANIVPPGSALPGDTRMRIRITYTGLLSPCGTAYYGEVEDYTVHVLPSAPAAKVKPNPHFVYYEWTYVPTIDSFFIGNFAGGHVAGDVNLSTVEINGITPTGGAVLPSYPGFGGSVVCVTMPLTTFITPYGLLFDTTYSTFTADGDFGDATSFSIAGDVTLIGRRSTIPAQYIIPPDVVVIPGDFDANGSVNISDAVSIIGYIFTGGDAPTNLLAGDNDCSGFINISDAIVMISYVFGHGPAPCQAM